MSRIDRVLATVSELRRVPVDPNDVYFLEVVGDDTLVRPRFKRRLRDVRLSLVIFGTDAGGTWSP